MKKLFLLILILFGAFVLAKSDPAYGKAHFTPGGSGYMLASMPPPGLYYLMYNVWFQSDDYIDNWGHKVPGDVKSRVFSQTHRFVWTTPVEILSGNLMFDLLIPVSYTRLGRVLAMGGDDTKFGLNDLSSHVTIAWHGQRYDALASVCVFFPIGEYHANETTSPGLGYWGLQPTLGLTLYFDEAKTWTWSTVVRYEISYKQKDTNITEGDNFHMESSLGKQLGNISLALSTAGSWQTTDAKGKVGTNDWLTERFALGPDFGVNLPGAWGNLNLRFLFDVHARNNPKGVMTVLTWTKVVF
jgi:hypothetical protein